MSELTKEKLQEVRGLIELGWTRGEPVDHDVEGPACYCLGGAIAKVLFGDPYRMYDYEVAYVFEEFVSLSGLPLKRYGGWEGDTYVADMGDPDWSGTVYHFNDEHTKEDVLEAIDKAVSKLDPDADVWAYLDGDTGEQDR